MNDTILKSLNKRQADELMAIEIIFPGEGDPDCDDDDNGMRCCSFKSYMEDGLMCGKFKSHISISQEPLSIYLPEYEKTLEIKYLPPITIRFQLPPSYPMTQSPSFEISCSWLDFHQLNKISNELVDICVKRKGCEIIYDWLIFIKNNVISTLTRGKNTFKFSTDQILHKVLYFDGVKKIKLKRKSLVECPICFDSLLLRDCFIQNSCEHFACKTCAIAYYENLIENSNNAKLTCLQTGCNCVVNYSDLKTILNESTLAKYDAVLLQCALDEMEDVQICPMAHCQSIVIIDLQSGIGICDFCKFAFCAQCRKPTHGFEACKFKNENHIKILKEYTTSSKDQKIALEKKHGLKFIKKLLEDNMNEKLIDDKCKRCPKCAIPIEKIDGCNKMICRRCRTFFCWLCLKVLSRNQPYLHYQDPDNDKCYDKLFVGEDGEDLFIQNVRIDGDDEGG